MTDSLTELFERQRALQVLINGVAPDEWPLERRIEYIREMAYALEDEVHEATDEVGWKSWQTKKFVNHEAYVGELVDVFHFLVNLFLVEGVSAAEVVDRYRRKLAVNFKRHANGSYDGVTNKCPACRRAYDDEAVQCVPEEADGDRLRRRWCEVYGYITADGKNVNY